MQSESLTGLYILKMFLPILQIKKKNNWKKFAQTQLFNIWWCVLQSWGKCEKVCKWGSTVCSSDLSRENREQREVQGQWVWGECEEKIDYGKGRKNYQRHFDLLQQSLFPLFLSLEKMQHKQQHVAFKHQVTTVWGKERRKRIPSFRRVNHKTNDWTGIKHRQSDEGGTHHERGLWRKTTPAHLHSDYALLYSGAENTVI